VAEITQNILSHDHRGRPYSSMTVVKRWVSERDVAVGQKSWKWHNQLQWPLVCDDGWHQKFTSATGSVISSTSSG